MICTQYACTKTRSSTGTIHKSRTSFLGDYLLTLLHLHNPAIAANTVQETQPRALTTDGIFTQLACAPFCTHSNICALVSLSERLKCPYQQDLCLLYDNGIILHTNPHYLLLPAKLTHFFNPFSVRELSLIYLGNLNAINFLLHDRPENKQHTHKLI